VHASTRSSGGKLDMSRLNWCEKVAVRSAHAREGEYRDWHAIDQWAATIAAELQRCRETVAPTAGGFNGVSTSP
jgi:hypothetical protein